MTGAERKIVGEREGKGNNLMKLRKKEKRK